MKIKKDRNTLFPIQHRRLFDMYETHVKAMWTPHEIDFSEDVKDFKKMNQKERRLVLQILAFFAQSDSIVNENLAERFMKDVNIPEALQFYSFQIGMEAVHAHTYALMIDTYVEDQTEKLKLFNAIQHFPMIAKKAAWMKKWIKSQESFVKRLLAFAVVEGIFFSGAFCAIYWLKDENKLKGLSMANDLIARDEGLHWVFAAELYKELRSLDKEIGQKRFKMNMQLEDLSDEEAGRLLKEVRDYEKNGYLAEKEKFEYLQEKEVKDLVSEAVQIEQEFITEAIPVALLGINKEHMCQYIEYMADVVIGEFGFEPIYNVKQPFDHMIKNDIRGKVNFFEDRATEYLKGQREAVNFDTINENF
jgi:ribonucleoside-diphosphate reductase beta chain